MNYYKDENNKVFAYDDEQIKQGYGKDLIAITEDEMKELTYVELIVNPKAEGEIYTFNGVDYKVSFTEQDQNGVAALTLAFDKQAITETVFNFSNGTKMPIAKNEFEKFALWFAKKRNSFFMK